MIRHKETLSGLKQSPHFALRSLGSALSFIGLYWRLATNARKRAEYLAEQQKRNGHYQVDTFTGANRFPELFEHCGHYLADRPTPFLLSFGCSTGEEVFSLKEYLPNARIAGVDINPWCIRQCRKKNQDSTLSFYESGDEEYAVLSGFDAIFCMGVFQHTDNRLRPDQHISTRITFQQFEAEVTSLDKKLLPGGLLIIDQCDFYFMDTQLASRYEPLAFEENLRSRDRFVYNRKNEKTTEQWHHYRIFVKRS